MSELRPFTKDRDPEIAQAAQEAISGLLISRVKSDPSGQTSGRMKTALTLLFLLIPLQDE